MWTPKRLYSAIGCICLFSCLLWTEGPASSASATLSPLQGPVPKRLLVIVPHPDDESLGSLALMQRTLQGGGSVFVALLTNGDGFRLAASKLTGVAKPGPKEMYQLGLTRQQEERQALHHLGLGDSSVEFLGYPDGSMKRLWSTEHWDKRSPIQALNGHSAVPYPISFHRGAPYAGQAVLEDLQRLFATYQPTDVLYPDAHDMHPDHWAANAFTQLVLASHAQEAPREWTYLVHFPMFPTPRHYSPQLALSPPTPLQHIGIDWQTLPLTAAQKQQKHQAILSHATQIKVMQDFLESFVRQNELLAAVHTPSLSTQTSERQQVTWIDPGDDQQQPKQAPAPANDIRKLTFAAIDTAEGKGWRIKLELARPVEPQDEWVFTFRQPDRSKSHLTELALHIQKGRVKWVRQPQLSASATTRLQNGLKWHTDQNRACLTIPNVALSGPTDLLLHAEIRQHGKMVDQTVWQRVQFQQETRSAH